VNISLFLSSRPEEIIAKAMICGVESLPLSEVEGDLVFLCGGDLVSSSLDSFLDNFAR
jgi:hypothetical protein